MLRGGLSSVQQEQQRQKKKRLSFRDPEVEGRSRKASASLEDLALEDRALNIAQNVGSAFSDLSITDNEQVDFSGPESVQADYEAALRETEIGGSSPGHRQLQTFRNSIEDQDCLDSPLLSVAMRGPSVEMSPNYQQEEVRLSSSAQHQVQLLRYQLEQQSQQTRQALHQAELLSARTEAETAARKKAQEQNEQLMQQNRELLKHMEKLFQQIEDLERQILTLEQERRSQVASPRQPSAYGANRRTSLEQVGASQNRCQTTTRKSSLAKPLAQNSTPARKTPSRPIALQPAKSKGDAKERDTLRIGDLTPPVQSSSSWKFNRVPCSGAERPVADAAVKKQDSPKCTPLFGGGTSRRYSSSTSDLHSPPPLVIEEPNSTASKLPRYQPYRGWQRRTSDGEQQQVSAIGKDSSYKTSLFNR